MRATSRAVVSVVPPAPDGATISIDLSGFHEPVAAPASTNAVETAMATVVISSGAMRDIGSLSDVCHSSPRRGAPDHDAKAIASTPCEAVGEGWSFHPTGEI